MADGLAVLCKVADEALMYGKGGAPKDWKERSIAAVKDAATHNAALLIAISPGVQKLVEAAQ